MNHQIEQLGDRWETAVYTLASSAGGGSHKKLIIGVRFDGNGKSIVRFEVTDHDRATTYETFDAAASAYNELP